MQQRDIIKDEIEQLGRALGKLIANFLGMKTEGKVSEAIKITNAELLSDLDIDINKLVHLDEDELDGYIESINCNDLHLDQLANYLFEVGLHEKSVGGNSREWFESAMRLTEIVGNKSDTITFARIDLIKNIELELEWVSINQSE